MSAARAGALPALVLVAVGTLVYARSLTTPFIYEDRNAIIDNPSIRVLWPPWEVLSPPRLSTIEGRPLVNVSLALNYALGGLDVRGYHALNLALHLGSSLLLFGITRRTLAGAGLAARYGASATWLATAVALLWSIHPLQTETVVYTHQRTELQMSFFYLLTLYCALRGWEAVRRGPWFAAAVVACALGMGSKEVMVSAPLVVLLYDRAFVSGSFAAALRRSARLYLGLAATWLVLAAVVDLREDSVGYHHGVTAFAYLLTQGGVIARYLRLVVWPDPLLIAYDWPIVRSLADVAPGSLVVLALFAATLWALVRRPRLGFLGAWFFLLLAPTSSVLPIVLEVVAERRMYLPLAALVALVVIAGHDLVGALGRRLGRGPGWRPAVAAVAVGAIGVVLAVRTDARIADYRSERILWEGVLEHYPHHPETHSDLGIFLQREGKLDEAVTHYREAIRRKPSLSQPHLNLAGVLVEQGKPEEAMVHYRATLALDPGDAQAHHGLAKLLHQRGDVEEAMAHYRSALAADPVLSEAHLNLGAALAERGEIDEALLHLREAVRLEPDDVHAHQNLGTALALRGDMAGAIAELREAVRLQPGNAAARLSLGVMLVGTGEVESAIVQLGEAVRLAPDNAEARRRLALALELYRDGEAHSVRP